MLDWDVDVEAMEGTGVVCGNFGVDMNGPTGSSWGNFTGTALDTGDTEVIVADKKQRLPNSRVIGIEFLLSFLFFIFKPIINTRTRINWHCDLWHNRDRNFPMWRCRNWL